MHTTIAAANLSGAVGPLSAGALALVLILVLVYGVLGKGKRKLASGPAQIVGVFCELAFLRAEDGSIWHDLGGAFQTIPASIADNPDLGSIGITGVCLALIVLSLFARIVPVSGAILGLLLGASMEAASGSIWQAIVSVFSIPFGLLGA